MQTTPRMLQLGSRLAVFSLGSGESENTKDQSLKPSQTPQTFLQYIQYVAYMFLTIYSLTCLFHFPNQPMAHYTLHSRKVTGLRSEHVFCNLRIPNQLQTAKDDINIIILTGEWWWRHAHVTVTLGRLSCVTACSYCMLDICICAMDSWPGPISNIKSNMSAVNEKRPDFLYIFLIFDRYFIYLQQENLICKFEYCNNKKSKSKLSCTPISYRVLLGPQ